MSPTTSSLTRIWIWCPPRITANLCSVSIFACSPETLVKSLKQIGWPLNWRSLVKSLRAVTRTTTTTEIRIATPSIQPASCSESSPPGIKETFLYPFLRCFYSRFYTIIFFLPTQSLYYRWQRRVAAATVLIYFPFCRIKNSLDNARRDA
jgi:hypothetical protein